MTRFTGTVGGHWQPLALIPNTQGYRFIGMRKDGTEVSCVVRRGDDGMHRVEGEAFTNLRAWRPAK
ncbi:MAG TPA: hypothetical protein VGC24_01360 [Burkholderiaceae bacterium]